MLTIIDATLTMLDEIQLTREQVEEMIFLLQELSITSLVISPKCYELLQGNFPDKVKYYLELPFSCTPREEGYPGIQCVLSNQGAGKDHVIQNVQINDIRELGHLTELGQKARIRITGLDDLLLCESTGIYRRAMETLRKFDPIFYPEDSYRCATAIALDYLQFHPKGTVMTTFSGIGNKAATEQVLVALRVVERRKPNVKLEKLSDLRNLFEGITEGKIDDHAPVIGRNIFHIESGVHVAGILKKSSNYEAYPPELVGAERKIVLGKHSGGTSVRYKIEQLGLSEEHDIGQIAEQVKRLSIKKAGQVTDEEFREIVEKETADEETDENC